MIVTNRNSNSISNSHTISNKNSSLFPYGLGQDACDLFPA